MNGTGGTRRKRGRKEHGSADADGRRKITGE
jgi:hypothetical protein